MDQGFPPPTPDHPPLPAPTTTPAELEAERLADVALLRRAAQQTGAVIDHLADIIRATPTPSPQHLAALARINQCLRYTLMLKNKLLEPANPHETVDAIRRLRAARTNMADFARKDAEKKSQVRFMLDKRIARAPESARAALRAEVDEACETARFQADLIRYTPHGLALRLIHQLGLDPMIDEWHESTLAAAHADAGLPLHTYRKPLSQPRTQPSEPTPPKPSHATDPCWTFNQPEPHPRL